jgi:hypothetical protein
MILPQVGSRTAGKRENQTKVRFALRKIPINGWKVKVRGQKELSQLLGSPHHEQPIAGSTRRSLGNVGRLFPYLIY